MSSSNLIRPDSGKNRAGQPGDKRDYDKMPKEDQERLRYGQDTKFRKIFSNWVIWLDSIYLAIILAVVILYGLGLFSNMNSTVMVTLLGTTTANVLGLAAIILNGLFKVKE